MSRPMKFLLPLAIVDAANAIADMVPRHEGHEGAMVLRHKHTKHHGLRAHHTRALHFGDTRCPCIGFDNLDGVTTVLLDDDAETEVPYPADLGARCEAWDNGVHPGCKEGQTPGFGNDWCGQTWCYVDSCNCDLPILPKLSAYVPDARYRGKPIFYSYATCGSKDTWADVIPEIGTAGCRCIGFDDIPGTIDVVTKIDDRKKVVPYPAELGGTCKAWDQDLHPECTGDDPASWCKQKWCYVDPCSCKLDTVPKVTMYLPHATFTGKSLYYSYETCGAKDHFTEKYNVDACVNQKTHIECEGLIRKDGASKCAWSGRKCIGAELLNHPLCTKMSELGANETKSSSAFRSEGTEAFLLSMAAVVLSMTCAFGGH